MSGRSLSNFILHSVRIRLECDAPVLAHAAVEALLFKNARPASGDAPPDITLRFALDSDVATPDDVTEQAVHEHGIHIGRTDKHLALYASTGRVLVYPCQGVAEGTFLPELNRSSAEQQATVFYFTVLSLVLMLRARGLFPLHAGALVRDGRGVLLVARSHSGKTTLAMQAVRHGWDLVSDDTVLLQRGDDHIDARSFRRDLCLAPSALQRFPELNGRDWPQPPSASTKCRIALDALYPEAFVDHCRPDVLVFPELDENVTTSQVESVKSRDALVRLITQSTLLLAPDPDAAPPHLDVLRHLVEQTSSYALYAGPDLLDTPQRGPELLGEMLDRRRGRRE